MAGFFKNRFIILFFIIISQISKVISLVEYSIKIFDSKEYIMKGQFAKNKNGDIIVEYSTYNSRIFYGIKQNGEGFFDGNYIKEIENVTGVRYESKTSFISLNDTNIQNQYLINFGANKTIVELYNIYEDISNESNYVTAKTTDILGNSILSYVNSLIELNNGKNEYLLIYIYDHEYILQKFAVSSLSLENIVIQKDNTILTRSDYSENRMVDGILLNEEYILILYISGDRFAFNLIDFNLNDKRYFYLDSIIKFEDSVGLFAKGINLKDNYVLFLYYREENSTLVLKVGEIFPEELIDIFVPKLEIDLTYYGFKSDPLLNKLIKINSGRCAFFAFKTSSFYVLQNGLNIYGNVTNSLTILLIDVYNNYQDLIIREYTINFDTYQTHREIDVGLYNDYLCFISSAYKVDECKLLSTFMIFGYLNQTSQENNLTINIYDYFTYEGNNNNIVDLIITNNPMIDLENNIFGYVLSTETIKLVTIPEEIEFYNKDNEETKLVNGDILNKSHILKEDYKKVQVQGNYSFEYQIIIQEPDYDTFNLYFNINEFHCDNETNDQRNFFVPQKFYGKIFAIYFTLYPEYYFFNATTSEYQTIQIEYTTEFIKTCSYGDLLNKNCSFVGNNNTEIYNKIIKEVMDDYPQNGESVVIPLENNYVYEITTMDNELDSLNNSSNKNNNLSIIDLEECGTVLRSYYNVSEELSLIFLKYEKLTNIASEKNIQYEVYHPISKEQLNLSLCEDIPISIYIPVNIPEETKQKYEELEKQGYDLFDPNDSFYKDLCTPFKSENGTDVGLNDRKIDYFNKYYDNNTQCQKDCKYDYYASNSGYIKCECSVNDNINTEKEEKFENKVIYESFYDILKNSNYKVVKCYKLVFNKDIIFKNHGSILVITYFLIYLIAFVMFLFFGINSLKIDTMKTIIQKQTEKRKKSDTCLELKLNNNNEKKSMNPPKVNSSTYLNSENNVNNNNINKTEKEKNKKHRRYNKNKRKNKYRREVLLNNNKINIINNTYNNRFHSSENFNIGQKKDLLDLKDKDKESNKEDKKLDDYEINNLDYFEACESDKRNFIDIYWSLLKREHIIIFTFFIRDDYNIIYIKFARFIFLLCSDMALNVFFFTDDSMHKVYKNYGKYDFVQQIPQIIYSTVVSQVLEVFLCYLSLTDKHIYQIKNFGNVKENIDNIFKILKCVKIKLVGFYLFTFILFLFYWYLISSFCAVYQNTQSIFIKDSLSSFALGLLYPFVLYLFPAFFRVISLKDRTKKRLKIIFFISDLIPIF